MALPLDATRWSSQEQDDVITPLVSSSEEPDTQIRHNSDNGDESNHTNSIESSASSHGNRGETKSTTVLSKKLEIFPIILYLALLYSILAVFAWTVTCYLVHRPIGAGTRYYGLHLRDNDISGLPYPKSSSYKKSSQWLQAARVIQTIVTVSTIPLTSAVCSNAAVVFTQRCSTKGRLSLRQTMALADKGWVDIEVYIQLLHKHRRLYGSTFLYVAIALNLLGALLSPLQSLFLTTATIQTPSVLATVRQLTDVPDFVGMDGTSGSLTSSTVAQLRAAITSASTTDPQIRLWSASGAMRCNESSPTASCSFGQASLANLSRVEDPFLAQLPAGYSTGLVRQFLPRFNSTAARARITEAEFPSDCQTPASFFANYSGSVATGYDGGEEVYTSYNLIACMPGNHSVSPWTSTRKRQDFSESLYLNLTAYYPAESSKLPMDEWSGLFRITLNTTTGYFELPNIMNGQRPGPLLTGDPNDQCGRDCISQGYSPYGGLKIYDHNHTDYPNYKRSPIPPTYEFNGTGPVSDESFRLAGVPNKGPLLKIAMALFGTNSFIADRARHPDIYVNKDIKYASQTCTEIMPFTSLLTSVRNTDTDFQDTDSFMRCVSNNQWNFGHLTSDLVDYVQMFIHQGEDDEYQRERELPTYNDLLVNAFEAAAFLANEQLLTSASRTPTSRAALEVSYDHGSSTQVPRISSTGITIVSILLSIYLASLLSMAAYSTWFPHWTAQFDSFAMMRLGAAFAGHLPLQVSTSRHKMNILDQLPGWVGDETGGKGEVGVLGLGARTPLVAKRQYE